MTTFDITTFYRDYVAALNARDFDSMDQFIADEVILNNQPGTREDVLAVQRSTVDEVPDFHWEIDEFLVDGDRAAVRAVRRDDRPARLRRRPKATEDPWVTGLRP